MNPRIVTLLSISLILTLIHFVIQPLRAHHRQLHQENVSIQKKLNSSKRLEQQKGLIEQQILDIEKTYKTYKKYFKDIATSPKRQQNTEQQIVQKQAKKSKVRLSTLQWAEAETGTITKLIMTLRATGPLSDLQTFISELENRHNYIYVSQLKINPVYRKDGEASIYCLIYFNFINET